MGVKNINKKKKHELHENTLKRGIKPAFLRSQLKGKVTTWLFIPESQNNKKADN